MDKNKEDKDRLLFPLITTFVLILVFFWAFKFTVSLKTAEPIANEIKIEIQDTSGGIVPAQMRLTESAATQTGIYNLELMPEKTPVKKIEFKNADVQTVKNLKVEDVGKMDEWLQIYVIDPTEVNFTNATVTVTAVGNELYKCKDWDSKQQKCSGEWKKIMDIIPGEDYEFILTREDPAFAELKTQVCAGEDNTATKGSFTGACDGTYPSACGAAGDLLSCNDNLVETHTFSKAKYAGVRVQQYNTGVTNCLGIVKVMLCYERWVTGGTLSDCAVSVDANGGASYSTVTTTCPGATANPGMACTDVTALETWACSNFFGASGTRALIKAELTRTNTGGTDTASWDVLFFNVTYNIPDTTLPVINSVTDAPDPVNYGAKINITANVTDNINVSKVWIEITGLNRTMTADGKNKWYYDKFNTSVASGSYNYKVYANDTSNNKATPKTGSFVVAGNAPTSNSPPDQTVDVGQETTITWVLSTGGSPGKYYVKRNGILYAGPSAWLNNTGIIIKPLNYFTGKWNYTIYFNDSMGNSGVPDTVFVNVTDITKPSCSEVTDSGKPVLKSITVDGNMADWDAVLANPKNYMVDLTAEAGDLDIPTTADRDLVIFAYTWDSQYLYMYFKRLHEGHDQVSMIAYMDYGLDSYMNATDKVVKFVWFGSNSKYDSALYNYAPAGTADKMNGSGHDMPGSITLNKALETGIIGGTSPGIMLETRVKWSDLGFSGPVPINFQPAAALGAGTNLPSQIEDNANVISSAYSSLLFRPNNAKSSSNGTSVYYAHDLMNCGLSSETVTFNKSSDMGYNVTLYYLNGSLITGVKLSVNNYTTVIAKVYVPGSAAAGTVDTATITALTSGKKVTDMTSIGAITLVPSKKFISAAQSMLAVVNYTVNNQQSFSDVIEINAASSKGWNVTLSYLNGSLIKDTDSDGHADVGNFLPGESKIILAKLLIPISATVGSEDITTIKINSSVHPSLSASATLNTSIKPRINLAPDYNRSIGIGSSTYFLLTITNSWNMSDTIDISHTSTKGYATVFYKSDRTTLLTDTDSDSFVDTGVIGGYGSEYTFYVKVTAPSNATDGDSELTTVYAKSSINTSIYDTAKINNTVRVVITYEDPGYSTQQDTFEVNSTIYARAHNLVGVQNVYFEWIDPNNTIVRYSEDIPVSADQDADDSLKTNFSFLLGNYTVVVFNAQNDRELGRIVFFLLDRIPPSIKFVSPTTATGSYRQTYIKANVTAKDGKLKIITAYLYNSTGLVKSVNSTTSPLFYNFTNLPGGTYYLNATAKDTSGNMNRTETRIIKLDAAPPVINSINDAPDPVDYNAAINFTANVTDNVGVSRVWILIKGVKTFMSADGTNRWYYDKFNTSISAGKYNYTIYANDTLNNNATPKTGNFTVNALISISMTNAPINFSSVVAGQTVNASISGWPVWIKNLGNVNISVKMKGRNLTGQTNPSYKINVTKVHWATDNAFTADNILVGAYVIAKSNLQIGNNVSFYYRLYTPYGVIQQNYRGNVTFLAVQS